jgi:hypothetical protein
MGMSNDNGLRLPLGLENEQHTQEESGEPHTSFHGDTEKLISVFKDDDVLLGRGKSNATHIGNVRFQGKLGNPQSISQYGLF